MVANHGMIKAKRFTTYTIIRDVGQSQRCIASQNSDGNPDHEKGGPSTMMKSPFHNLNPGSLQEEPLVI